MQLLRHLRLLRHPVLRTGPGGGAQGHRRPRRPVRRHLQDGLPGRRQPAAPARPNSSSRSCMHLQEKFPRLDTGHLLRPGIEPGEKDPPRRAQGHPRCGPRPGPRGHGKRLGCGAQAAEEGHQPGAAHRCREEDHGIGHGAQSYYFLLGLGGQELWEDHVKGSALVINEVKPHFVRVRTAVDPPHVEAHGEDHMPVSSSEQTPEGTVIELQGPRCRPWTPSPTVLRLRPRQQLHPGPRQARRRQGRDAHASSTPSWLFPRNSVRSTTARYRR
ncbi:MAG: hypothetical protein MZV70_73410 [Desulfobacterales bacterium]|nr:hypothetical protein [Desulfobacterales bacterium]